MVSNIHNDSVEYAEQTMKQHCQTASGALARGTILSLQVPSGVTTAKTQFLGFTLIPYFLKFSMMSRIVVHPNNNMTRFLMPAMQAYV